MQAIVCWLFHALLDFDRPGFLARDDRMTDCDRMPKCQNARTGIPPPSIPPTLYNLAIHIHSILDIHSILYTRLLAYI